MWWRLIDGEWDEDTGEIVLRIDEEFAPDVVAIVEFYRVHGPQMQLTAAQRRSMLGSLMNRRQDVADALGRRLAAVMEYIEEASEGYEEGEDDET